MGLIGVDWAISPELLKVLSEMGHGDEIVFADAHFPAASSAKEGGAILVRLDGLTMEQILPGVLKLFPLDEYVPQPAAVMDLVPSDAAKGIKVPIWDFFRKNIGKEPEKVERFDFYKRAKQAYAIVATGELSIYANLILKKGLVPRT